MFTAPHGMFTPHGTFSPLQLLPMLLLLPVIAFWLWMFRDMLDNSDLPRNAKESWTFAFIILNVFAAAIYYGTIYKNRH